VILSHVLDTKRHTILCTENNVETCNAPYAAVDYLTMKERDLPEELTVTQIKYSLHFNCNPKLRYNGHNSATLVPILSQIHLLHDPPTYYFQIQFNVILLSKPNLQNRQYPAGSLPNPVIISLFPIMPNSPCLTTRITDPVRSTNHDAPCYVIFTSLMLLPHSQTQPSSSVP